MKKNQLALLDETNLFNLPVQHYFSNREFISHNELYIDFCSTNYLGFDFEESLALLGAAYVKEWGTLTQWSRMEADCHLFTKLEQKIANFIGANQVMLGHTITSLNYSHIPGIIKKGVIFADQ